MNKIVIDGYNMIHRVPTLRAFLKESLERAREELILYLKSYLMRSKVEVTLVFDGRDGSVGPNSGGNTRNLTVLFSKEPFKADPLIKKLIVNEPNKKGITIVTDDADIVKYAKSQGANVLSPARLFGRIMKRFRGKDLPNKFDRDLTDEELAEWLEIFNKK